MTDRLRIARVLILILCLHVTFYPADLWSQEIIRWGDAAATGDQLGLRVTAFSWQEASTLAGALTDQLDLDGEGIRPLKLDPEVDLASSGDAWNGRDVIFDGDPETSWRDVGFNCQTLRSGCDDIYASLGTNEVDLGGQFLIDRIVIVSGLDDPALMVRDFRIHLSPDLPSTNLWCCDLLRPVLLDVRDNREQVRVVRLPALRRARFLQVAIGEREMGWEIHDIQAYGTGFVERSSFISNIVAFDGPMAWGELGWSGDQKDGARVLIQTRTGTDPDPQRYWRFTGREPEREEVTQEEYLNLRVGERAGTTYDRNWSFWSAPYDFADSSGVQVVSPGPRRYVQVRVEFLPDEDTGGELRRLELRAWLPLATALVGEVWPIDSPAGEWRQYTYALRPTIASGQAGFDRLEIRSVSFLGDVHDVRIGDASVSWQLEAAQPHRLVIRLPRLRTRDSGVLVEVDFDAQVLRYGSTFDGQVWVSDHTPSTVQRVDAGDATAEYEGNRVAVATTVRGRALLRLALEPRVLTANGDGTNDRARLTYEIFEIIGAVAVRIDILDLSGRRVRRVHEGSEGVGRYERRWDGRDDAGRLVPPGVYVARVSLSTDEAVSAQRMETIHVVY